MHSMCDDDGAKGSLQSLDMVGGINVLFADHHPLTLSGLRAAVASHSDIRVLSECMQRTRLGDSVRRSSPDVLLVSSEFLDDQLSEIGDLIAEHKNLKVILLTSRADAQFFEAALINGVSGIFERHRPVEFIPLAIRQVIQGAFWFEQVLAERMLQGRGHDRAIAAKSDDAHGNQITDRERELIELICKGLRNREISSHLQISQSMVSEMAASVFKKLEVEDRVSLVIYAVKNRLVSI